MPRKKSEPRAPPSTLTIQGEIAGARIEVTITGIERRPLLALLDEILGAVEGEKKGGGG